MTNLEVRSMIESNSHPSAVVSGIVTQGTTHTFTSEVLGNVIHNDPINPLVSSTLVNYVNLYVYAKDASGNEVGYASVINNTVERSVPHVVTALVYNPFDDSIILSNDTSIFSTYQTITKMYKPIAFAEDVDFTTTPYDNIKQYALDTNTPFTVTNIIQNSVGELPQTYDNGFTHFVKADGTTETVTDKGAYVVKVLVEYTNGEVGVHEMASVVYEDVLSETVQSFPPTSSWTSDTTYHPHEGAKSGDYYVWTDTIGYGGYPVYEAFNGVGGNGWVTSSPSRHTPDHPVYDTDPPDLYVWGDYINLYIKLPKKIALASYDITGRTGISGGWTVYGTNEDPIDLTNVTWTALSDQSSTTIANSGDQSRTYTVDNATQEETYDTFRFKFGYQDFLGVMKLLLFGKEVVSTE
eukprot:9494510-Pyramimonas_sp.AAC.1